MKKIITTLTFLFLSMTGVVFAQNITTPKDSIDKYLCKSWETDYSMLGGMKIMPMPGAPTINYEFKKDKTFISLDNKGTVINKGTWLFDPKKKVINIKNDNGINNKVIVSLNASELIILLTDTKETTPDDPSEVKLVLKAKGSK